jgi:hypothetical protein
MKRRGKGRGRKPKRKGYRPWKKLDGGLPSDIPSAFNPLQKSDLEFMMKPETKLVIGVGQLLMNYVCEKILPGIPAEDFTGDAGNLTEEMRSQIEASIKAEIGLTQHPEAKEPVRTLIDEHQEGRSEVIREIANPKQS